MVQTAEQKELVSLLHSHMNFQFPELAKRDLTTRRIESRVITRLILTPPIAPVNTQSRRLRLDFRTHNSSRRPLRG
jgi:peptidyl-tRNA hydrolase